MIHLSDDIILVGSSELRTDMPKIAKALKVKKVIVTKKGKPLAVLQDFKDYEEKEALLEKFEDLILGFIARERETTSKKYLSEKVVSEKLGILL